MSDENIKQKAFKRGFGSPETRGALLIGTVILCVLAGVGFAAYSFLKPDTQVQVATGGVDASNVKVKADAKTSEAYKEAKQLTDEYLFEDHLKWLKWSFEQGHQEFPDDYDFNSSRWSLGLMIAQVERYGGIVMDTKKGTLPVSLEHPTPDTPSRITEKE